MRYLLLALVLGLFSTSTIPSAEAGRFGGGPGGPVEQNKHKEPVDHKY